MLAQLLVQLELLVQLLEQLLEQLELLVQLEMLMLVQRLGQLVQLGQLLQPDWRQVLQPSVAPAHPAQHLVELAELLEHVSVGVEGDLVGWAGNRHEVVVVGVQSPVQVVVS